MVVRIDNFALNGEPREIVIRRPPERVVAIWQNSIETLFIQFSIDIYCAWGGKIGSVLSMELVAPRFTSKYINSGESRLKSNF